MNAPRRWTPDAVRAQSRRLEESSPQAVLRWARGAFERVAQGTGFGPSGVVIMHMLARQAAPGERDGLTFFFLDTGVLFEETYALRERLEARLGVHVRAVEPRISLREQANVCGEALWDRAPDQCCHIRKVRPLKRFLRGQDAWVTGVRRDQSETRRETKRLEWDETHAVAKVNPLATWTREQVWAYINRHDLPYNPLHDRGYPSIGCRPCTEPAAAAAGDDEEENARAGRWNGHEKTECGLHLAE
ncbi:MAG: phosphoadenylyl-sulfate reductase [Bacteroidetes bacterium QS_7_67_15]|nr:MAG: phosphoadenylyl-sulfate reductase [Bacteroidetes bacterium QS_7_67_15]